MHHSPTDHEDSPAMMLVTGESRAKKRILGFLTVFLMTGVISEIQKSA